MRQKIVAALLVLSLAATARAENKEAAKLAYSEATRHYDLGEYADALAAFKKAYWNYEEPAFLFNIAQCHRQLGNKAEAVKFYRTYLKKVANAPNREAVQKIVVELDQAIERDRQAQNRPPQEVMRPEPAPASAPIAVTASAPEKTPVYKKWWLWTAVGAVVVVGVAVGVGVGVGLSQSSTSSFPGVRF